MQHILSHVKEVLHGNERDEFSLAMGLLLTLGCLALAGHSWLPAAILVKLTAIEPAIATTLMGLVYFASAAAILTLRIRARQRVLAV
ncbi:hypothetical protein ACEUZ9_002828 [Paracoccus litorisediminis]|uniref:hypothetical protein n=1 Tax=Paracoccus litorisediminis TaxID=2006130 RepID=UPI0037300FCE